MMMKTTIISMAIVFSLLTFLFLLLFFFYF
jgi:hypothetical protein